MRPRRDRFDRLILLMAAPALACLFNGCAAGAPASSQPSTAADKIIAEASDDEERRGLVQARDDIDAEMRDQAAVKDAEIEKLRKENEALRAKLKK